MKKNLISSIILLLALAANAQRYEWVSHADIAGTNGTAPVAVDPAGNIYTLIYTGYEAIIQGDTIHTITGSAGCVITKFDPAGNLIWGKMMNVDAGGFTLSKIAADNAGAVYASFVIGNGVQVHFTDTTFLPAPGLIVKLDSSGHFVHDRSFSCSAMPITSLGTDIYIA